MQKNSLNYKILFPFVRSDFGGSYVSSSILIKELIFLKHNICVVMPWKGISYDYFFNKGITPYLLWNGPAYGEANIILRIYIILHVLISGFFYVYRNNFEIIHCNDDRSILMWGLLGKIFKIKTIWHIRNSVPSKYDYFRCLLADSIISVSKFTAGRINLRNYNHIIYNPVEFEKSTKKIKDSYQDLFKNKNSIVLLHVGRNVPGKRLDWSINACKKLAKKISNNVSLIVIGSGVPSYTNIPSNLKIHFIEHLQDIKYFLENCDLVIHPSNGNVFGLDRVLQECIVLNKNCICTDTGANNELSVYNNNLYYSFDNRDAFAEKVLEVVSDRSNLERPVHMSDIFNAGVHCKEVLKVYNEEVSY